MSVDYERYRRYIDSTEWRQRADEAKRRAGYRCRVCYRHATEVMLNAHHRTYERLYNEDPDDITVLCRVCHELYHKHERLPPPPKLLPAPLPTKEEKLAIPKPPAMTSTKPPTLPTPEKTERKGSSPYEYKPHTVSPLPLDNASKLKVDIQLDQPARQSKQIESAKKEPYQPTGGEIAALVIIVVIIALVTFASLFASRPIGQTPTPTYTYMPSAISTPLPTPTSIQLITATPIPTPAPPTPLPLTATPTQTDRTTRTVNETAVVCGTPCSCAPAVGTITEGTPVTILETVSCGSDTWYKIGEGEWLGTGLGYGP